MSGKDFQDMERLKFCTQCRSILQYTGNGYYICPECQTEYQDDFSKVKEYLYHHPGASITQVHIETGVPISKINQYLKIGRLEIPENSKIFIHCESCGKEIRFGRFCRGCASQKSKNLSGVLESEIGDEPKRSSNSGEMHFWKTKRDK